MALLSLNRIAWLYTSDDGTVYRVTAQKALTDQNKLGGSASDGTEPAWPGGRKKRRIVVFNVAQNVGRVVTVYDTTAAILTDGATINLNHLADSYSFTKAGKVLPEEHDTRGRQTHETT